MTLKVLIFFMVLLAAFAGLTLWKAARHEARAEASHPPGGQFVEVAGHRVHARVMGAGPDVVLIHGASGNLRDFTFSLAPRLAERYRVIALDRPGLGYTPRLGREAASLDAQAALLMQAAGTLGATRPIVLGHSYGGAVALTWAANHPDRIAALVPLAAASNPWTSDLEPYYRVTAHPLLGPVAVALISAWVPDRVVERAVAEVFAPQQEPPGYAAHFGPGLTLRRDTLRANALQRAAIKAEIARLHTRWREIAVPTEILHGTDDTTVGLSIHSEPLAGQIPDARLTRLEGVGHMPHHSVEAEVIAAVDRAATRAGLR